MILFSDRGTPDGFQNEHGYSGHSFKWCKDDGSFVYVQVHVRADKGFKVCPHITVLFGHILILYRLWTTRRPAVWQARTPTTELSHFSTRSSLVIIPHGQYTSYVPDILVLILPDHDDSKR